MPNARAKLLPESFDVTLRRLPFGALSTKAGRMEEQRHKF